MLLTPSFPEGLFLRDAGSPGLAQVELVVRGCRGSSAPPGWCLGGTSSLGKLLCPAQPFAHPGTGQVMHVPEPCVLSPVWWYLSHSHLLVPFWWEIYLYPKFGCQAGGSCGVVHGAGEMYGAGRCTGLEKVHRFGDARSWGVCFKMTFEFGEAPSSCVLKQHPGVCSVAAGAGEREFTPCHVQI